MTERQIQEMEEKVFKHIDIVVNNEMSISLNNDSLSVRQKDFTGKSKTCTISRANWFQLMKFTHIIDQCFILKPSKK